MWTLAHKGCSGNGRLAIWVYPTEQAALLAGAHALFETGDYRQVMQLYEATDPGALLLRVQPAFVQFG